MELKYRGKWEFSAQIKTTNKSLTSGNRNCLKYNGTQMGFWGYSPGYISGVRTESDGLNILTKRNV
jgi:hypothetical protein